MHFVNEREISRVENRNKLIQVDYKSLIPQPETSTIFTVAQLLLFKQNEQRTARLQYVKR